MAQFRRSEVEEAFSRYWEIGCVGENWTAWTNMFTDDVSYLDHFWGMLHGREEVQLWIDAVMAGVPEIYTVLDWYTIEDALVTFHSQNRRDNPNPDAAEHGEPAYWDFAGLSALRYAGDGLWAAEEDFWDVNGARRTSAAYAKACERGGFTDPLARMTRKHWDLTGPAWTRTTAQPNPSWLHTPGVKPLTRPSELYVQLGRERQH